MSTTQDHNSDLSTGSRAAEIFDRMVSAARTAEMLEVGLIAAQSQASHNPVRKSFGADFLTMHLVECQRQNPGWYDQESKTTFYLLSGQSTAAWNTLEAKTTTGATEPRENTKSETSDRGVLSSIAETARQIDQIVPPGQADALSAWDRANEDWDQAIAGLLETVNLHNRQLGSPMPWKLDSSDCSIVILLARDMDRSEFGSKLAQLDACDETVDAETNAESGDTPEKRVQTIRNCFERLNLSAATRSEVTEPSE